MYREVQLDLKPEIEVFHMLFERCHTKNRERYIYQTAYKIHMSISGFKFSLTALYVEKVGLVCHFRPSPPK